MSSEHSGQLCKPELKLCYSLRSLFDSISWKLLKIHLPGKSDMSRGLSVGNNISPFELISGALLVACDKPIANLFVQET